MLDIAKLGSLGEHIHLPKRAALSNQSDADSAQQLQSTNLLTLASLYPWQGELKVGKTCSRSQPNLVDEGNQFTSPLLTCNQLIGLTLLPKLVQLNIDITIYK